jgi:hypothetical protein
VKLKQMGLQPGWPDFLFILPGGRLAVIELKAKTGSLSADQKGFRRDAMALGVLYSECRTIEDVEEILVHWLLPFGLRLKARLAA